MEKEENLVVGIKLLKGKEFAPKKAHDDDACYDVFATEIAYEDDRKIIYKLGFKLELEEGYSVAIRPRSSIHKKLLLLSNSPGTGDSGYKGEYMAVFYKLFPESSVYEVGDRVAQIKIEKDLNTVWKEVEELSESERGSGGYGSSGGFTENKFSKQTLFRKVKLDSLFYYEGEEYMKLSKVEAYNTNSGQTSIFGVDDKVVI